MQRGMPEQDEQGVVRVLGVTSRARPGVGWQFAQPGYQPAPIVDEAVERGIEIHAEQQVIGVGIRRLIRRDTGSDAVSMRSSRSKNNPCTWARWQACSWTDHRPGAGRRVSTSGATSRTIGTMMPGARSRASSTAGTDDSEAVMTATS